MPIVFASILLGGCGSGDKKPLTKAEFVSKANAICAPFTKRVRAETKAGEISSTNKEAVSSTSRLLPLFDDQVARLKELVPPGDEQRTYGQAMVLSEEISSNFTELLAALRKNDEAAIWRIGKAISQIAVKRDILFIKLGTKKCATTTIG